MSAQFPTPSRRQTAQEVALAHIRALIAQGRLMPEDRIRQEQLATELGSSVIPVREALKTLEAEGQVRYQPHRGYRVTRLSLGELTETYLIRRLLEDEIVRIAAPLLTAEHYEHLEQCMATMELVTSHHGVTQEMVDANRDLHFTLYGAANRPRMVDFIRMLWQTTDAYRSMYYTHPDARHRVNTEHRSIVDALRAGEIERAIDELDAHRNHAVTTLKQLLVE